MKRFFEEIKFIVNPFEQVVLVLVNEIKYNSIILQCQEFFLFFSTRIFSGAIGDLLFSLELIFAS